MRKLSRYCRKVDAADRSGAAESFAVDERVATANDLSLCAVLFDSLVPLDPCRRRGIGSGGWGLAAYEGLVAMRRLGMVLALILTMGLLAAATPALATFPGPDGRIAFGSDRYGGTHNIFTMNPDGSDVRQLTFLTVHQGAALNQSWSPDGTKLVFQQRTADFSVLQIHVMNADGSNQYQLFSDPAYFSPSLLGLI